MINPKNHGGKIPRLISVIFEATIKNKSAKTSSLAPVTEVQHIFLAIFPSMKSVRQTAKNKTVRLIKLFLPYTNCPVTFVINRMDKPILDIVMLLGINLTKLFMNLPFRAGFLLGKIPLFLIELTLSNKTGKPQQKA